MPLQEPRKCPCSWVASLGTHGEASASKNTRDLAASSDGDVWKGAMCKPGGPEQKLCPTWKGAGGTLQLTAGRVMAASHHRRAQMHQIHREYIRQNQTERGPWGVCHSFHGTPERERKSARFPPLPGKRFEQTHKLQIG